MSVYMIRSMTGFGSAPIESGDITGSLELRSVNSRHLKLNFRLPPGAELWEEPIRGAVGERIRRGHVDVTLRLSPSRESASRIEVDELRLASYLEALRRIQDAHALPGTPDLEMVSRLDSVLVERTPDLVGALDADTLTNAAHRAADELIEMRSREGDRLAEELNERLNALFRRLEEIEVLAPLRLESERARLQRAVAELAGGVDVDDDRLAREIAVLADRWDIREEIVRARAHIAAFRDLLQLPGEEPVGKRLGFLSQELLREVNTVGSKSNDAKISHHVVEAKNELETMREQIENIE
ncbi:MAG: YicC family protein [Gemmatimonadota bacterium]